MAYFPYFDKCNFIRPGGRKEKNRLRGSAEPGKKFLSPDLKTLETSSKVCPSAFAKPPKAQNHPTFGFDAYQALISAHPPHRTHRLVALTPEGQESGTADWRAR